RRVSDHFRDTAPSTKIWQWLLSPDREWLLWKPRFGDVFFTSLSGTQYVWERTDQDGTMCWLGKRSWGMFVWGENEKNLGETCSRVVVGNLDAPGRLIKIPFPARSPFNPTDDLVMAGTRDRILALSIYDKHDDTKGANRVDIFEWVVHKNA